MDEKPAKERPSRSRRREEAGGTRGVGGDQAILRMILEAIEELIDATARIGDLLEGALPVQEEPE